MKSTRNALAAAAHGGRSDVNVRRDRRKAFEVVARPPPDVTPRALRLRPVRVGSAPCGLMRSGGGLCMAVGPLV